MVNRLSLLGASALVLIAGSAYGAYVPGTQLSAANNTALGALSSLAATSVLRLGFAAIGDAPPQMYNNSGSACTQVDGGWQVASSDGKCWVASFENHADVREWGAGPGVQSDTALNAAVAMACVNHIPLTLPYPGTNPYLLNSSIVIGNGSAGALSTCNGVTLSIDQGYNSSTSGTTPIGNLAFRYNGASTSTIPIVVQGPAAHLNLLNVTVDCGHFSTKCATGIEIINVIDGEFKGLGVEGNIGPAFKLLSVLNNTWQGSLEGSHFSDFQAQAPATGGSGMDMGLQDCGIYCGSGPPVIANQFDNITLNWDGTTAGTYGVRLGFVSQITGTNIRLAPVSGVLGNPIVIRPPANTGGSGGGVFPADVTLIHPLVDTAVTAVLVDTTNNAWVPGSYNGLSILNWPTVWQAFPTYSTNPGAITGNDTAGRWWPGAVTWTPTDSSGAGLSLTVQDATYSLNGNVCNVVVSVTYPATADATAAGLTGLPSKCRPITGSGTSRIAGTVAFSTYSTAPFTALMSNAGVINFYTFGGTGITNSGFSGKIIRLNFSGVPVN